MRYMLFLVVALAASLAWQSTVFASLSVDRSCTAVQDEKDKKESATDEEPDCD